MKSEHDFLRAVVDAARLFGWRAAHFRPAQTNQGWRTPVAADAAGFPDLVLVHALARRVLWRELKLDAGKLSQAQEGWLSALQEAGEDAAVWRPGDWPAIEAALRWAL